jgi:hypothetical protein
VLALMLEASEVEAAKIEALVLVVNRSSLACHVRLGGQGAGGETGAGQSPGGAAPDCRGGIGYQSAEAG